MLKVYKHLKMRTGGRAEIENVPKWPIFYIFNFSSAIRGHFSNVSTLVHNVKNEMFIFLKDGRVIKLKAKM